MNSYDIIVTPDAEAEISELAEYISVNFGVPEVALNYIQCIRREIKSFPIWLTASHQKLVSHGIPKECVKSSHKTSTYTIVLMMHQGMSIF